MTFNSVKTSNCQCTNCEATVYQTKTEVRSGDQVVCKYSLDYVVHYVVTFTQESLLSSDLLRRFVLPSQSGSTAKPPCVTCLELDLYSRLL